MDDLRCNSLRCRKSLSLEGSSHVFCIDCANALFGSPQICPACEASLPDPDDVTQASLNPHDSYKTSILSGLSPAIILDIASRALNFWAYQQSQESAFQALITKNAQERISVLEAQLNAVTREASAEISLLKERVATSERDLELERRRVRDLQETHKSNAKAYNKLKAQYDKAKQRALLNPGDPNLAQAFNAPAPSPAAARQAFVPAPGNTNAFSRSTSSASVPQTRHTGGGAGWVPPGAAVNSQGLPYGQHTGLSGSSSRVRKPLHEQQGVGGSGAPGGQGAFLPVGGGGGNSTRRKNLVNATGQQPGMAGDGLPQFLGQGLTPRGGGQGRSGAFRPSGLGSRHSG
ncbi:hypothetical protein JCM10213v2_000375 [Rhodosporidiobolus nylandii]